MMLRGYPSLRASQMDGRRAVFDVEACVLSFESAAGIRGGEVPVWPGVLETALVLTGGDFVGEGLLVGDAGL